VLLEGVTACDRRGGRAVWGVWLDHLDDKVVGSNPAYGIDVFLSISVL
jgi:hypothetical protein